MNPRTVTTGVTNPEYKTPQPTQSSIDWLQYSVEWPPSLRSWPSTNEAVLKVLNEALPPCDGIMISGEILRPLPGYSDGIGANHARLFWHRLNRMQHIGVIFTGIDMQSVLSIPYPHEALLRWCVAKSRKIARLDFALDTFDPRAQPRDILHEWKHKRVRTPAKKVIEFSSWNDDKVKGLVSASTVYVGARQSDTQLRVYDKAKESGVSGSWTRIEFQTRDEKAWSLANAMLKHGISIAGQQAIRNYFHAPLLPWWKAATDGPTIYIEPVGRRETATEKWLMNVVIPTIKRVAMEQIADGRWTLYDALEDALADTLRDSAPNPKIGEEK